MGGWQGSGPAGCSCGRKSRMNFKTCLCFGCDQQSQRGLCVLLCEQAQKEGANAAPHSPLPCCSVAERGRALETPLPPCRGPGSAPSRAVLEEEETGDVHSAGSPAAAVPRCSADAEAGLPSGVPECPGRRAWVHPRVWAPGAPSGTRAQIEMVAKHPVFGLCPLSLF